MPRITKKTRPSPAKRSGSKKITVTTSIYGDTSDELTVEIMEFDTEPAYVSTKLGTTKSITQFEFLRVDVSIMMPCVPHPEVVEATFERITDHAIELLDKTVDDLLGTE